MMVASEEIESRLLPRSGSDTEYATLMDDLALAAPAMTAALTSLVGLPSWCQESTGRPPFGLAIDTALDEALQLAAGLGLRTYRDPQGYYGWAELGEGDELLGLLGHVDMLPLVGQQAWFSDPLNLVCRHGVFYGAGCQQGKGPLVAALHALGALQSAGEPLHHRVRLIIGTDAASGQWRCMARYRAEQEIPHLTLALTGEHTLVMSEKRLVQGYLQGPPAENLEIECDNPLTRVPDRASYRGPQQRKLMRQLDALGYPWLQQDGQIIVLGQSAPAAQCGQRGINAIVRLCRALSLIGYRHPALGFCSLVVGDDPHVRALVGDIRDEQGRMTLNLASLRIDSSSSQLGVDIRIPVGVSHELFRQQLRTSLARLGWHYEELRHEEPLQWAQDAPILTLLAQSASAVCGEPCQPRPSAEVSYARALPATIPFGAAFADQPDSRGQANEHLSAEALQRMACLYADAVLRLQTVSLRTVLGLDR